MPETVSNNLYHALQRLNRYMRRSKHLVMPQKEGIHRGHIHLLFLISKNSGVIQRDLAEMIDMRPSSLTEKLIGLEKHSLIKREQDKKDRRVMHVYLTDEGKSVVDGFARVDDKLLSYIFNSLTEKEAEIMLELVNKINANLETIDNEDTTSN